MNITVKVVKENKDGSADVIVNYDAEALGILLQEGILRILEAYIKQNKNAKDGVAMRKRMNK